MWLHKVGCRTAITEWLMTEDHKMLTHEAALNLEILAVWSVLISIVKPAPLNEC